MTAERETLTDLIRAAVGPGNRWTFQAFQERAVDPESGYRPSTGTIQKIKDGSLVKIHPKLVAAIAAGLGLPESRVGIAAHRQYIGTPLESRDPFPDEHPPEVAVTVTGAAGMSDDMPLTLGELKRILSEIEERHGGRDDGKDDREE